jgi:hypothetical protein
MTKSQLMIQGQIIKTLVPKDSKDILIDKIKQIYLKEFKYDIENVTRIEKRRSKVCIYRHSICHHLRFLGFEQNKIASLLNVSRASVIYHENKFKDYLGVQDPQAVETHYIFLNYINY